MEFPHIYLIYFVWWLAYQLFENLGCSTMVWGVVPWDAVPWGVVPWGVVPPLYILETNGALGVKIS